jgi:hypothetical protein
LDDEPDELDEDFVSEDEDDADDEDDGLDSEPDFEDAVAGVLLEEEPRLSLR